MRKLIILYKTAYAYNAINQLVYEADAMNVLSWKTETNIEYVGNIFDRRMKGRG